MISTRNGCRGRRGRLRQVKVENVEMFGQQNVKGANRPEWAMPDLSLGSAFVDRLACMRPGYVLGDDIAPSSPMPTRDRARPIRAVVVGLVGAALLTATVQAQDKPAFHRVTDTVAPEYWEVYGNAEIETTFFLEAPRFANQERHNASFAIEPTFFAEWLDGDLTATFTPFFRADRSDDDRTHVDIREAKFQYSFGDWDATVGIDTVFWGKAEANHLVDIINQTDSLEDIDDEDALGQPMLRLSRLTDIGTFTAFYLPYFRERPFPGERGRLRSGLVVDEDQTDVQADGGNFAPSFALRYDGVFQEADVGLSLFHGVSRDPGFAPTDFVNTPNGPVPTALQPIYTRITQVGFDGQYTDGPTLYKAEAIFREGQLNLNGNERDFFAATGGLEHTLFGVFDNADLGLILEYSYDSRGDDATNIFQNDVILGARLALNDEADTSLLVTGAIDHEHGVGTLRLEAQRRIAEGLVAEIEGNLFINSDDDPLGADFQDDSFVRLKLTYFW